MTKVIFEFDSLEDKDDIDMALNGYKWKLIIQNLDQQLRDVTKYNKSLFSSKKINDEQIKIAELLRELIRNSLQEYNLNID
jgi:hypothetical protein